MFLTLLLLDTTEEVLRNDGTFWALLGWRPTGVAFFPAVALTNLEGMGGFRLDVRLFFLDVQPVASREFPPLAVDPASELRRDEETLDALLLLFSMLSVLLLHLLGLAQVSFTHTARSLALVWLHM